MKTFFVTLVAFSLALFIGCHDNILNEPAEALLKSQDNLVTSNTIKLCCQVQDPSFGTCNLNGYVRYALQIINRAMNPTGLNEILLHLEMDSKLYNLMPMIAHLEWRAQGRSDDIVYVSEEGILLVEKSYWITNRPDVVLLVQYLVTTDGVGISGITIAPIEK